MNVINRIGIWASDQIHRFLPEPTEESGGHAWNISIIGFITLVILDLLIYGLISAIITAVFVLAILLCGMYAGIAVFKRNGHGSGSTSGRRDPRV